jgi:iron-sulfur cluster repair protein YtfE (RIC family)
MHDDLDTRTGLPPELRVLAERYPRDLWQGHANFSGLTAFWLDRHGAFRTLLDRLTTESRAFLDGASAPRAYRSAMAHYSRHLLGELHGHHWIEDTHYFPALAGLDARVAPAFDLLEADHVALSAHIDSLAQATNAVLGALAEDAAVEAPAGALLDAQERFGRFLDRHLADEEEIVVPLILEYAPALT